MMKKLSGESIAILAVGATVAGVTLASQAGFHSRMDRMEARIDARMEDLGAQLTRRIDDLDAQLTGQIEDLNAQLTRRIDDLDARLTGRIDDLDVRSTGRIDDLDARLISVEEKVTRLDALDIGPRLRALEAGQAALRESVARIEGLVRGLLERLAREDAPAG